MLSPTMISDYQVQSLANARDAVALSLNAMQQINRLSLRTVQAGAGVPLQRALLPPESASDYGVVEELRGLFHESLHLASGWLIDLVKVAEAQWAISHRCAHAAVREMHKWSPRELETAMDALDLALDVAESATENLTDAGVMVVKRIEDEGGQLCAGKAKRRARPGKAAGAAFH